MKFTRGNFSTECDIFLLGTRPGDANYANFLDDLT